jgi:hypothetical protein
VQQIDSEVRRLTMVAQLIAVFESQRVYATGATLSGIDVEA